ncbi:MAG: hypothetical protein QNJ36_19830 [Calothrix sp. MO_167.B42]|nr:hypothetical protein [Calothrix sp. MO_167.B42]
MSKESERLQKLAAYNRLSYHSRINRRLAQTPIMLKKHDTVTGLGKLQDAAGNLIYAKPVTNGAVGKGDVVAKRHGAIASYDSTSTKRRTSSSPPIQGGYKADAALAWLVRASQKIQPLSIPGYFPLDFTPLNSSPFTSYGENGKSFTQAISSGSMVGTYSREFSNDGGISFSESLSSSIAHPDSVGFFLFRPRFGTGKALEFFSPNTANITIEISFTPGGFNVYSGIGITIDGFPQYTEVDYLEPGEQIPNDKIAQIVQSTCDAFTTSSSLVYETQVEPGLHFISFLGIYSWDTPGVTTPLNTNIAFSFNVSVDCPTKNKIYLQNTKKTEQVLELEDIEINHTTNLYSSNFDNNFYYLTNNKNNIYLHIQTEESVYNINNFSANTIRRLYRIVSTKNLQHELLIFEQPQEIPELIDDWQGIWTNAYLPQQDSSSLCINVYLNIKLRKSGWFSKQHTTYIQLFQSKGNFDLIEALLQGDKNKISAIFNKYKYSSQQNGCKFSGSQEREVTIKKTNIPDVDASQIVFLIISVYTN